MNCVVDSALLTVLSPYVNDTHSVEYVHTKFVPTRCKIENQGRRYNFQSTGPYNLGPCIYVYSGPDIAPRRDEALPHQIF